MSIEVRKVYSHLPERCFGVITDFKIKLTDILKEDVILLVDAIDYADQIIDDFSEDYTIDANDLLLYLQHGDIRTIAKSPQHVSNKFQEFRSRLTQKQILDEYITISNKIIGSSNDAQSAEKIKTF